MIRDDFYCCKCCKWARSKTNALRQQPATSLLYPTEVDIPVAVAVAMPTVVEADFVAVVVVTPETPLSLLHCQ